MDENELLQIEARALRATPDGVLKINRSPSCYGCSLMVKDGKLTVENEETYHYEIKSTTQRKVIHQGLINVPPGERPLPSADAVFIESARADVLKLVEAIRALQEAAAPVAAQGKQ